MAREDKNKKPSPKKTVPSKRSTSPKTPHATTTPKTTPKKDVKEVKTPLSKHERNVQARYERVGTRLQSKATEDPESTQIPIVGSDSDFSNPPSVTSVPPQVTDVLSTPAVAQIPIVEPDSSSINVPTVEKPAQVSAVDKAKQKVDALFKKVQPPQTAPKPTDPKILKRIEESKTQSALDRIEKTSTQIPKILVHPRHSKSTQRPPSPTDIQTKPKLKVSSTVPATEAEFDVSTQPLSPTKIARSHSARPILGQPAPVPESKPLRYQAPTYVPRPVSPLSKEEHERIRVLAKQLRNNEINPDSNEAKELVRLQSKPFSASKNLFPICPCCSDLHLGKCPVKIITASQAIQKFLPESADYLSNVPPSSQRPLVVPSPSPSPTPITAIDKTQTAMYTTLERHRKQLAALDINPTPS